MTLPATIGLYLSIGILVALYPLLNGGYEEIYNDFISKGGISQIDRIRIEGRFGPNALLVIALIVFFTYTVFAWPKFLFYMIWPEKED